VQTVHSLSDRDKEVRLQFCHFQGILPENPDLPNILMSEKAHFHWQGTVNKQNFQYWLAANITNVPFMTRKLLLGLLFGPEESLTLLLRGQRWTSHQSHMAFHRDDQ